MRISTVSRRSSVLVALLVLSTGCVTAQPAPAASRSAATQPAASRLTLEKLFASPDFFGTAFEGGRWADAGAVLRSLDTDEATGTTSLVELDLTTDRRRTLLDGARLVRPDGEGVLTVEDYAYSADGTKALLFTDSERVWRLNTKGLYYVVDLASGEVTPVADRAKGLQMFAKFSPDGRQVAFVRDRNLFVVDLATGQERALTTNGAAGTIINGTFDWVYEEEFGLRDGFQWSPDGQRIAFYQLDESATRDFQITNLTTLYPEYQSFRYPKAGEANAEIHIGVIDVATGETRFLDTDTWGSGGAEHEYIAGMGWTPALADGGSDVWLLRLNRNQNHVDLMYADPAGTAARTVLSEENDSYIEVETGFSDVATGTITYLRDGRHFVWRSDRDGYGHLYLYTNDGTFVRQVTQGEWDVTNFHGVDERAGVAYVTTTAESPRERHLYRVPLAGGTPVKLTQGAGWHDVDVSRDFAYFTDTYSTRTTPPVTTLHRATGERVSVLDDNAALIERLAAYNLPSPEFMTVPAADGTPLEAYLIRPSTFDPNRRYPLLIHTYGGPGSQEVVDRWGGTEALWHHYLAETYGVLVAGVDNRGTGGRGKAFKTLTQNRLGILEAEDQTAAAQWFGRQAYVDSTRLGIWGWSYGGYLSLLAMTYGDGPETFHAGIAVAPVTNWRTYDTIYTERYLTTPQLNPTGYDAGSPTTYAANLRDDQELLIVHGDADDNVHVQNTMAMVDALQAAGKPFEMMLYPGRNHGIYGGRTRLHLYTMMTRHIARTLADQELQAQR
ncbi:MAG TPA: S9 family peptidase [Rubricoccaceae bacterium]|jgi:dipeptidyl-peptidase-4